MIVVWLYHTRKKLIVSIQKKMRKESKYNTKESHPTIRKDKKEKKGTKRNYKNSQKTINKMAISTYLSDRKSVV